MLMPPVPFDADIRGLRFHLLVCLAEKLLFVAAQLGTSVSERSLNVIIFAYARVRS
jgi:hypothetical protein